MKDFITLLGHAFKYFSDDQITLFLDNREGRAHLFAETLALLLQVEQENANILLQLIKVLGTLIH